MNKPNNIIHFPAARLETSKGRIVPEYLCKARKAMRLSQSDLANRIGVTRQAIFYFEQGTKHPDVDTMVRIMEELQQPMSYFIKGTHDVIGPLSTRYFRAFGTDTKKRNEQSKIYSEWLSAIASFFAQRVNFPKIVLPSYQLSSLSNFYTDEEIEAAASMLRKEWEIGDGPIGNLMSLVESKGIFVAKLPIANDTVNAFSYWSGDAPFIILGSDDTTATRIRFDIAHELGHLMLHRGIDETDLEDKDILKRIENEANRFAGEFLLPSSSYPNEVFSTRLEAFVSLKSRWKVSIAAQVFRCKDLGLFSEAQVLNLYKQISAQKWRKKEPLDAEIPLEEPVLLRKAFELLMKHNALAPTEVLNSINLNQRLIETFCNLPQNALTSPL